MQLAVRSRAGATRCPYCHDACEPTEDVRVCRDCLSRHHSGCWKEAGACASCAGPMALGGAVEEALDLGWHVGDKAAWSTWVLQVVVLGVFFPPILRMFGSWWVSMGVELPFLTRWTLEHPLASTLFLLAPLPAAIGLERLGVKDAKVWARSAVCLLAVLAAAALLLPYFSLCGHRLGT